MEELRTPCAHRGGPEVLASPVPTPQQDVSIHICQQCRRFWLERNGWLLSRRETLALLRTVAVAEPAETLVR